MPWDITISRASGQPLGELTNVIRRLSQAVPALRWIEEPPLLERIKGFPDHPFHKLMPTFSEDLRASFARSRLLADYKDDGLSIRLYGFDQQTIDKVHGEVRGNGNPLPILAGICLPNGWQVIDDSTSSPVDLTADHATGFGKFQAYRDRAVQHLKESQDDTGE